MSLAQKAALDDLAQHLYDFLPGKPHPYADSRMSFPGVAQELGLGELWPSGSKQPALRHLLGATLDGKRGFPTLIVKIVERGITYRKTKSPVTREEIEGLNAILTRVGYKIPELHEPAFLDRLPRAGKPRPEDARAPADAKTLAGLQDRLLKLGALKGQERGYAFEGFLTELFELYKLAPRGSFRLIGEQNGGRFPLKN